MATSQNAVQPPLPSTTSIAVGQLRTVPQTLLHAGHLVLDAGLRGGMCPGRCGHGFQRRDLLVAHLGGSATETAVGGEQIGRDGDGGGVGRHVLTVVLRFGWLGGREWCGHGGGGLRAGSQPAPGSAVAAGSDHVGVPARDLLGRARAWARRSGREGRTRRPVRFCSSMWALHPASRAQVNIDGEHVWRAPRRSRARWPPRTRRWSPGPGRAALAQLSQRRLLERLGDLEAGGVQLLGRAAQDAGARVLGAVHAVAEAHQPLAAVEDALDVAVGVTGALDLLDHAQHTATAPRRAAGRSWRPTAPEMAAATSAPVEAMTREVKVEAFMPCSAARDEVGVDGLTCRGSGSPRQRHHEAFHDRVRPCRSRSAGPSGCPSPRADWAT